MPMIMEGDDSFTFSAWLLLGIPRKDMPNAFTKHAAASAPVRARAAPPRGDMIFEVTEGEANPRSSD